MDSSFKFCDLTVLILVTQKTKLQNLTKVVVALASKVTARLFKRLIIHKNRCEVKEGYDQHRTPAKPTKDVHNEEISDRKDEILPSDSSLTDRIDDLNESDGRWR